MNVLKLIAPVLVLLSVVGCSENHVENLPERDPNHKNTLALAMEKSAARANRDSVLALFDEAVLEFREGREDYNPVELFSEAGHYFLRSGQDVKGAQYMREAADSLKNHPPKTDEEKAGAAKLLGNLGNLYKKLGMEDDALSFNLRALTISEGLDSAIPFNLWRMRAVINQQRQHPDKDSVLYCYDQALRFAGESNGRKATVMGFRLDYMVSNHDLFSKDKIKAELKSIEELPWRDGPQLTALLASMGNACVYIGEYDKGIPLLEEALTIVKGRNDILMTQWIEKALCRAYSKNGQTQHLARIYPELDELNDTILSQEKLDAIVGADFRFRVQEKEREAQILREREKETRKLIITQWIALVLGVILLAALVVILIRRERNGKKERKEMEVRISDLINRQVQYNSTIDTLNQTLDKLNAEIGKRDSDELIKGILTELKPAVLNDQEETTFRRAFNKLHPHFLAELRQEFPSFTSSDELLCMLIFLKQNTEEIAYSLGISRQSVNTARYRLRKRMNLDKETDLDNFITSRRS